MKKREDYNTKKKEEDGLKISKINELIRWMEKDPIMGKTRLKTRKITACFSLAAFMGGVFFVSREFNGIAGNVTASNSPPTNTVSLIGLFLIFCSVILGAYSIKYK